MRGSRPRTPTPNATELALTLSLGFPTFLRVRWLHKYLKHLPADPEKQSAIRDMRRRITTLTLEDSCPRVLQGLFSNLPNLQKVVVKGKLSGSLLRFRADNLRELHLEFDQTNENLLTLSQSARNLQKLVFSNMDPRHELYRSRQLMDSRCRARFEHLTEYVPRQISAEMAHAFTQVFPRVTDVMFLVEELHELSSLPSPGLPGMTTVPGMTTIPATTTSDGTGIHVAIESYKLPYYDDQPVPPPGAPFTNVTKLTAYVYMLMKPMEFDQVMRYLACIFPNVIHLQVRAPLWSILTRERFVPWRTDVVHWPSLRTVHFNEQFIPKEKELLNGMVSAARRFPPHAQVSFYKVQDSLVDQCVGLLRAHNSNIENTISKQPCTMRVGTHSKEF